MSTEKLYCYVDEIGQNTGGKFFVVTVAVTKKERDDMLHFRGCRPAPRSGAGAWG
jgi:hypothetical protein